MSVVARWGGGYVGPRGPASVRVDPGALLQRRPHRHAETHLRQHLLTQIQDALIYYSLVKFYYDELVLICLRCVLEELIYKHWRISIPFWWQSPVLNIHVFLGLKCLSFRQFTKSHIKMHLKTASNLPMVTEPLFSIHLPPLGNTFFSRNKYIFNMLLGSTICINLFTNTFCFHIQ